MTLKPTDMLQIQSAIDAYEKKFRRPAPSAEEALAWRMGKRKPSRVPSEAGPQRKSGENGFWSRAFQHLRLLSDRWTVISEQAPESFEQMTPWVRRVLVVGGWSVGAVVAISLFFFGALVGGFR